MRKTFVTAMLAIFALLVSISVAGATQSPEKNPGIKITGGNTYVIAGFIDQPEPQIGEAWTDLDGDGVNDNGDDNCLGLENPDQKDTDGDKVGDDCDVCPEDPNPGHQDLDICAWADDDYDESDVDDFFLSGSDDDEAVEDVEDVEDVDVDLSDESGGLSYFGLSEEEFNSAMASNAAAGAGCSLAQTTPAINALGIVLIAIGLLQIFSRRRR